VVEREDPIDDLQTAIDLATGATLDSLCSVHFGIGRVPGTTDEALRERVAFRRSCLEKVRQVNRAIQASEPPRLPATGELLQEGDIVRLAEGGSCKAVSIADMAQIVYDALPDGYAAGECDLKMATAEEFDVELARRKREAGIEDKPKWFHNALDFEGAFGVKPEQVYTPSGAVGVALNNAEKGEDVEAQLLPVPEPPAGEWGFVSCHWRGKDGGWEVSTSWGNEATEGGKPVSKLDDTPELEQQVVCHGLWLEDWE